MSFYYEPKSKAKIDNCVDVKEYNKAIEYLKSVKLTTEQRALAEMLATRFIIFNYEKLADYYANCDAKMQSVLEYLKCVIVDTDSAIKNGYFKYLENYSKLLESVVKDET